MLEEIIATNPYTTILGFIIIAVVIFIAFALHRLFNPQTGRGERAALYSFWFEDMREALGDTVWLVATIIIILIVFVFLFNSFKLWF